MNTYWEYPSDYPNAKAELRAERDAAQTEVDRLNELLTKAERKINNLTAMLEDVLDWCRDNQDVVDGDDGQPQPDAIMRMGTDIEEVLGKGGRYGF